LFAGVNTAVADAILRQLGSKLQIIPRYYPAGFYNMSMFITPKEAVWFLGQPTGLICVHQDFWNTAVIKDWKGYGLLYNNITNLEPSGGIAWTGVPGADFLAKVGDYEYSDLNIASANYYLSTYNSLPHLLNDPVPCWWTHADNAPDVEWKFHLEEIGIYPADYFPWDYHTPALSIAGWRDWMVTNDMPLYFIRPHGFSYAKTSFAVGEYINYSDIQRREVAGSLFAYATGENIIVAALKPLWLVVNYNPDDIDGWYKTKELSNWLLNSTLEYADMFNSGGLLNNEAHTIYHELIGSPGPPGGDIGFQPGYVYFGG
jgi:hypothetical protein